MKATIDSTQLQVYVTLARLLNMSRAAEELGLTPSGISHCLKNLETDLGCQLFERTSRKMSLTQAGREFLAEAGEILERMKSLRGRIGPWTDWKQGQLRIGAGPTACQFILPPALREFREGFPEFTVKIEPCSAREAASFLAEGRLDLALFIGGEHPGLASRFLAEDDLHFVVHPLHPWALKRKVAREDLSQRKLIVPEKTGDTYALIEAYFREENVTIQPFIEIANEEAIQHFVRLNMGAGILPRWMLAEEISQGLLVGLPLGRRRLKRRWGMLHAKTRNLTFAEDLFTNICRHVLQELISQSDEPHNSVIGPLPGPA